MRFKAVNIKYDTDGKKVKGLPKSMTLNRDYLSLEDVETNGADEISDRTDWCVFGFDVEEVK